jgi:predicted site-specific integrase-resolvase
MNRSRLQSLLITRGETAEMLGVSGFTLWRWHKNGFLKPLIGAGGRTAAYLRGDVERVKATAYLDRLKPGRPTRKKKEASV